MAITVTALTSGGDDTYLFSYSTASVAPTSGRAGKLYVESTPDNTDPTAPTITGAWATWTLRASKLDHPSNTRYWVFEGSGAVTTEAVVIDFGTTGDERFGCNWIVLEVSGASTPSYIQSTFATGTGSSASGTLSAFAGSGNGSIIFGNISDNGEAITPGTGWTELVENGGTAFGASTIYAAWRADNDTSPDFSWTPSLDWLLYAEETAQAAAGEVLPVTDALLTFLPQDIALVAAGNVTLPVTNSVIAFTNETINFSQGETWIEGTLTFTGQDINLVSALSFTLTVDVNAITLSGQSVATGNTFTLSVDVSSLVASGQNITLSSGILVVPVTNGTLNLSGQNVALLNSQSIPYVGSRLAVLQVSPTGRTQWKDYVPVKYRSLPDTSDINRTDSGGALAVTTLSSGTGLVEWKDYRPVVVVAYSDSGEWRFDDLGFIPVVEVS